ncbi:hypothetical protein FSARC_14543 [Fusarium sarcochroum]|uniref:Uncharacterized protein n=1 Tax=Fusarium sarcochroum TaxID=1208366 RepID=A0A8H4SSQ0_9HYPO|nr:hypothetical protein FSARC_14543 [Fusarium sarcochroum]
MDISKIDPDGTLVSMVEPRDSPDKAASPDRETTPHARITSELGVITVHVIRNDYKTAWLDNKRSWILKEQLFKNISVREINYSYEVHDDSILYHSNGIHVLAEGLVNRYSKERESLTETETDRPIIWVCHDLGGTITKEVYEIIPIAQALKARPDLSPKDDSGVTLMSTAVGTGDTDPVKRVIDGGAEVSTE